MKLTEMQVKEFMQVLGSSEPAPGGGSASALAGSMGISLTKMVTELTIGKKKYLEYEELAKRTNDQATKLQVELLNAIDKDTEAFNDVSAVFSMPKSNDEEKALRSEALQKALQGAAKSPYEMMSVCVEALKVTKQIVGKSNINAASDLGVAALNLKSALQGAWLNVLINLSSIKDQTFVDKYRTDGENLLNEGSQLADEIYNEIVKMI